MRGKRGIAPSFGAYALMKTQTKTCKEIPKNTGLYQMNREEWRGKAQESRMSSGFLYSIRKTVAPLTEMWDLGGNGFRKREGRWRDQF